MIQDETRREAKPTRMKPVGVINNEKGLALVLSLMLVLLLACLGIWLISQSGSALKITGAYQRMEESFHLAEGACWLSVRAIDTLSIALPDTASLTTITPVEAFLDANQPFGRGRITPQIQSSRDLYNTTPPEGWMINWQGAYGFHKVYYLTRGQADIQLPASKGNARSVLYNLVEKPMR